MKFTITSENFLLDEIPYLKGNWRANGDDTYDISDSFLSEMRVFEKSGFVKILKDLNEIENAGDIIRKTESVSSFTGEPLQLAVTIAGSTFLFDEKELLSSRALRIRLLRLKKIVEIKSVEWKEILKFWFEIATELDEPSEAENMAMETLNYVGTSTIYFDASHALDYKTLYFDEGNPGVVYCLIEKLIKALEKKFPVVDNRNLRKAMGNRVTESKRIRVAGIRYRFWGFKINECELNLESQKYRSPDEEDELEND